MATENSKSSFIPQPQKTGGYGERTKYNLFSLTGIFLFIFLFLITGGMLGFEYFLETKLEEVEKETPDVEDVFYTELLDKFVLAEAQINSSESILDGHLAPSIIFSILEKYVTEDVYFRNFNYRSHYTLEGDNTVVELIGSAPSYEAVAFQSDVFKDAEEIKSVKIRDVASTRETDEFGDLRELVPDRVSFEAVLEIEGEKLLFKEKIEKEDEEEETDDEEKEEEPEE